VRLQVTRHGSPRKVSTPSRHKGFKSKAQWRKFAADPKLRRYFHEKAHATKGGKIVRYRRLPSRRSSPTVGSVR
jgi:hypothetical protein